jgi:hypothetical protein
MDLIDDLGSDLAVAFLVEQKHRPKLDSREAVILIDRVKTALQRISRSCEGRYERSDTDTQSAPVSH